MSHIAGLLLDSGITSYVGGDILRKSFSLKYRAKRAGITIQKIRMHALKTIDAQLGTVEYLMQGKDYLAFRCQQVKSRFWSLFKPLT